MICEGCKFAQWERTSNGRLHPSGNGRCTWELPHIDIPVAKYVGDYHRSRGRLPSLAGGYISRSKDRPFPQDAVCMVRVSEGKA